MVSAKKLKKATKSNSILKVILAVANAYRSDFVLRLHWVNANSLPELSTRWLELKLAVIERLKSAPISHSVMKVWKGKYHLMQF